MYNIHCIHIIICIPKPLFWNARLIFTNQIFSELKTYIWIRIINWIPPDFEAAEIYELLVSATKEITIGPLSPAPRHAKKENLSLTFHLSKPTTSAKVYFFKSIHWAGTIVQRNLKLTLKLQYLAQSSEIRSLYRKFWIQSPSSKNLLKYSAKKRGKFWSSLRGFRV